MNPRKPDFDKHPLDLKTGRLLFTPVLRSTGQRLDLEVDYNLFPRSKALGHHGNVQDLKSGKWYSISGKECDIPGCNCDAWVEEITPPSSVDVLQEWCNIYEGLTDEEIEEIEKAILQRGETKPTLIYLEQTCEFTPAQWEGRTADDRPVYIRGRHEVLSVRMGPIRGSIDDAVRGEEIMRLEHEEADVLSSLEMVCLLSNVFDFSKLKKIISTSES